MTCGYCQFSNAEGDHRCRHCGRRLLGTVVAAPQSVAERHIPVAVRAMGANALAIAPAVERRTEPKPTAARQAKQIPIDTAATLDALPRKSLAQPAQTSLFASEFQAKIIEFDTRAPRPAEAPQPSKKAEAPAQKRAENAKRRPADSTDTQATLDFLPPLKNVPRTTKTNAEAVIFCDAKVAAPIHRATAAVLDASMIALAFGAFLLVFQTWAKPAHLDRLSLAMLGGMLALTALLYGVLFAIGGSVTPGMHWTHLRLINFDGFTPDGRSRALRLAGCWIGVLSGGLGLLWALLDEENLSWHDHMSKTFPTLREPDTAVVRHASR